jgi:hypothetical protein
VTTVLAALLDLSNIVGGFLLSSILLWDVPKVGPVLARFTARVARAGDVVGVIALMAGGYWVIVHLASGPHVFHFELVGAGIGVALLRRRLFTPAAGPGPAGPASASGADHSTTSMFVPSQGASAPGTSPASAQAHGAARSPAQAQSAPTGGILLLAVFGLIAIAVGIQGLMTPDG